MREAFSDAVVVSECRDGSPVTVPAETSGENGWGLFGAGGNVWETSLNSLIFRKFGGWQGGNGNDHCQNWMRSTAAYIIVRGAVKGFRLVSAPVGGKDQRKWEKAS
jgi:hypothetical protein